MSGRPPQLLFRYADRFEVYDDMFSYMLVDLERDQASRRSYPSELEHVRSAITRRIAHSRQAESDDKSLAMYIMQLAIARREWDDAMDQPDFDHTGWHHEPYCCMDGDCCEEYTAHDIDDSESGSLAA